MFPNTMKSKVKGNIKPINVPKWNGIKDKREHRIVDVPQIYLKN